MGDERRVRRTLVAMLALAWLLLLIVTTAASAKPTPVVKVMQTVAAGQVQGYRDDGVPLPELRAMLARGQRIVASCGTVSLLARAELRARGIEARLVGAVTRLPFDYENDGHIMVEARASKHEPWTVYDPDMNRQPLDRRGEPMGIARFTREGYTGRFRWLAHDPAYDYTGYDPVDVARWIAESEPHTFYDRVLGTPTVIFSERVVYHGSDRRLSELLGYQWVPKRTWRELMGRSRRGSANKG